uniref:Uncharacterized protein n=1 Tax=Timema cristinae TaxID=61476 RepID=A0A7R9CNP4_TIMCR|nr:unnamed protein product [Timema cristinae]
MSWSENNVEAPRRYSRPDTELSSFFGWLDTVRSLQSVDWGPSLSLFSITSESGGRIETNFNQTLCEEENEVMPTATLIDLVTSVPGGETVDEENIEEWLECDVSEPGFGLLTDVEITNKVMGVNETKNNKSTLLMDTKFSFPVRFPFNPSKIRLEDIEVPEVLNLPTLKKV